MTLSFALQHRFPSIRMDIAFQAPSPGLTALFGPSGSGKSTIINAAAGLLHPDICRITVNGTTLADTAAGIWLPPEKRRIGLVFQDSRLFPHMSVATNLRFGLRRAPTQDAIHFDEIVDLLGIAALLDRRPKTLSGGERQRVAIARAFLANRPILILDEATSSLDSESEAAIAEAAERLMAGRTCIVIAHRLSTVRAMDRILVFRDGNIVEEGSHQALVAKPGGLYRDLFERQALGMAEAAA
jgi:molybdate transport system ATP-binding protein